MNLYIEKLGDENVDLESFKSEVFMAGAIPEFSRKQVDGAGSTLISNEALIGEKLDQALTIINNWRSCHSVPLNIFRRSLRTNCNKFDHSGLVAQRIKRLPSIELKLRRFPTMKLCQMQDIGGCRAVVKNVEIVNELLSFYKRSQTKSELVDIDNYIEKPKDSGYRGIHLIYRYNSDKNTEHNKLKIEIQLRSKLQHAWATAVETVGTFIRQALKSSQGEQAWLRFFALMGTAIANREKTNPVPGTPTNREELVKELREYKQYLSVDSVLEAFGDAVRVLTKPSARGDAKYFLLHLDVSNRSVSVTGFQSKELELASQAYLDLERTIGGSPESEAVLVSVDSLQSLQTAFPNYFLDTKLFIEAVNKAVL